MEVVSVERDRREVERALDIKPHYQQTSMIPVPGCPKNQAYRKRVLTAIDSEVKRTYSSPAFRSFFILPTSSRPLFIASLSSLPFSPLSFSSPPFPSFSLASLLALASRSFLIKEVRSGAPSVRLVTFVNGLSKLSKWEEVEEGRMADWGTDLSR